MRSLFCACALAACASAAHAQQPGTSPAPPPAGAIAADSLGRPVEPDCVQQGPAAITSVPPLQARRVPPGMRAPPADSLCLTRAEAVSAALLFNPQLAVAQAQTEQARARRVQGIAIPDPQFGASFEQSPGIFGAGGAAVRSVGASLTIPFPDKFRLRGRIGTADVRSAEFQSALTRQTVAASTSAIYDSLLAALRRRRDLREARALARDFARKTEARFNAGTTPRLDVVRARLDVAQAENQLIANERDIANARAAVNRLLGRPLAASIAAADSLAVPPPLPDLTALEAAALVARPELASLQSQQRGAHATTALAREYWLPDFIIGVSRDYAAPGPGVLTTGVALPLPIFFWQHTRGEIAESKGRERELAASLVDLQAQVGQDVRIAYSGAATALRQTVYLRDELLPTAQEAYRIASVSYGLGGSSALEVLEARRSLLDAQSQYTDALTAANTARADLERAVATSLQTFALGDSHDR